MESILYAIPTFDIRIMETKIYTCKRRYPKQMLPSQDIMTSGKSLSKKLLKYSSKRRRNNALTFLHNVILFD